LFLERTINSTIINEGLLKADAVNDDDEEEEEEEELEPCLER